MRCPGRDNCTIKLYLWVFYIKPMNRILSIRIKICCEIQLLVGFQRKGRYLRRTGLHARFINCHFCILIVVYGFGNDRTIKIRRHNEPYVIDIVYFEVIAHDRVILKKVVPL